MPAILTRLEGQLRAKGYGPGKARAIAISSLQRAGDLKKGSTEATAKGEIRGKMTPGERAKDRAAKYSSGKHKPADYKYNKSRNLAILDRHG
jgi:hypothetical protein